MALENKICTKCNTEKSTENFYVRCMKDGVPHYRTECKQCHSKEHSKRYAGSAPKRLAHYHAARKYTLNKYDLSVEGYEDLLQKQGGVCKICGGTETWKVKGRVRNLCVDHCHKSGAVRGLLCRSCNVTLGKMGDDPELFKRCIRYLEGNL